MKTRKNVRDTFKINDKLSDIKKEQFSIISLEKNEDDINDIKVNYKYFDETLKTNSISFKNKWLYEAQNLFVLFFVEKKLNIYNI